MKVKCIIDGLWYKDGEYTKRFPWSKKKRVYTKGPKKGEIVTVSSEYWRDGEKYYRLIEYPSIDGVKPGYNTKGFKPLENAEFEQISYSKIIEKVPIGAQ